MARPIVSFVLPIFNAEYFLFDSINSILGQSFPYWELLIVDDGSTDNSLTVINSFNDYRIKILKNEINRGIVNALNQGLRAAQGKYIARMDADDICEPERIERQVEYMEANPNIILSGTKAKVIDGNGVWQNGLIEVISGDQRIKAALLFSCPFVHPSIMIRREALIVSGLQYDTRISYAQDYVLYSQLWKYGSFGNLPQPLLRYRVHGKEVRITSDTNNAAILKSRMLAWRNLLQELQLDADDDILRIHDKCVYYIDRIKAQEMALIPDYLQFLKLLGVQNNKQQIFDTNFFRVNLKLMAYKVLRNPRLGTAMFLNLWLSHTGLLGLHFWLKLPFKRAKDRLTMLGDKKG